MRLFTTATLAVTLLALSGAALGADQTAPDSMHEKHYSSMKYSWFKPANMIIDDDIQDALEYDTSTIKTVSYKSPDSKLFSASLAASFNDDFEIDKFVGGIKMWGIVTEVQNGTISGNIDYVNNTSLENYINPTQREFENDWFSVSVGYEDPDWRSRIMGIQYLKYGTAGTAVTTNSGVDYTIIDTDVQKEYFLFFFKDDLERSLLYEGDSELAWTDGDLESGLFAFGLTPKISFGWITVELSDQARKDYETRTGRGLRNDYSEGLALLIDYELAGHYLIKHDRYVVALAAGFEGILENLLVSKTYEDSEILYDPRDSPEIDVEWLMAGALFVKGSVLW